MSDLMEKTIDQAEIDRAIKLLHWLEKGWIKALKHVDQIHLIERLKSTDEMMIRLGLDLYDRLDSDSPKGILPTPEGLDAFRLIRLSTMTPPPEETENTDASVPTSEVISTEGDRVETPKQAVIADILSLVGTRRLLIEKLLPVKSQRGLFFFLADTENPENMPLAHLEKLRSDLQEVTTKLTEMAEMEEAAQMATLEKDVVIDDIEKILRPGPGRDYQVYFEERVGKSLKRHALRQRELPVIQRILAKVIHLDALRAQEAMGRQAAKDAARAARESKTRVTQAPPSGPTWMENQKRFPVGRANPQGISGVAPKRGDVVPGAGKGTKEKGRMKGK